MKTLITLLLLLTVPVTAKTTTYLGGDAYDPNSWTNGTPVLGDYVILQADIDLLYGLECGRIDTNGYDISNWGDLVMKSGSTYQPIVNMSEDTTEVWNWNGDIYCSSFTDFYENKFLIHAIGGTIHTGSSPRTHFGNGKIVGLTHKDGDINGDNKVDFYDLAILAQDWLE